MSVSGIQRLKLILILNFLVFGSVSQAGIGLTYQGRILKPDGTPMDSSNVRFTIEIKSYNDCLLYKEIQSANLSTTVGVFSLNIGSAPAPQTFNYVGGSLSSVFTNAGTFTGLAGCTGGTYTPNVDDDRKIVVSFEDLNSGSPTYETIPAQNISYVPFAIESYQIAGYTSQNLLRVNGGTTPALTPANVTELLALINGSSTQYVSPSNNGVTSINFSAADFTGGTITSSGTVTLKDIITGATKGSASKIPQITYDNKGRITSVTEMDLTAMAPTGNAGGDLTGVYPNPTIADDSITSAKIKDGEIVNADISASAGIVDTKLATLTTAGKVANSATTGSSANTPNTLVLRDSSGDFAARNLSVSQLNSNETYATDLYIRNSSNKTMKFNIGSGISANFNLVWPDNTSSTGKVLSNDGNGNLSWTALNALNVIAVDLASLSSTGIVKRTGASTYTALGVAAPLIDTGTNIGLSLGTGLITSGGNLAVNVGTGANQIPQLDGSGKLNSSVLPAGTSTQWTTSGSDIYYNTGNVGVGTNSPSAGVDIATASPQLKLGKSGSAGMVSFRRPADGSESGALGYTPAGVLMLQEGGAGEIRLNGYTNSSIVTVFTNNTERLRVDGSGNVGLGTTAPSAKLDVSGNINLSSGSSYKINANNALAVFGSPENIGIGPTSFVTTNSGGGNVAIGKNALNGSSASGYYNIAIGMSSLQSATSAGNNTSVGVLSQTYLTTGTGNSSVGYQSLNSLTTGTSNVALGNLAGLSLVTGNSNTFLGFRAGSNQTAGSRNIVIGQQLDAASTTGNDQLNIGNTIYGDLAAGNIGIGITSPGYKLDVNGSINIATGQALKIAGTNICTSAGCTSSSDRNLKENIFPLKSSLEKILRLQGVSYDWKDKERFGFSPQVGLIAQDVEKIYPQVVVTDPQSGLKSIAYDHLVAPLIEAFKSLVQQVHHQSRSMASLEERATQAEKENAELKAYLCGKDPQAPFCRK